MFSRPLRLVPALAEAALFVVCALLFALTAPPAKAQTSPPANALAEALDAPGLAFASSGAGAWFSQKKTTSDGVDAAQSGPVGANAKSTLTVSVTGITKFSFKWKVSSESNRDLLTFYIDDVAQSSPISGNVDWQTRTHTLSGAGAHTLRWEYAKDGSVNSGQDAAWVDQFTILDSALPIIVEQPADQSVAVGDHAGLFVQATGGGPFTYQWYKGESGVTTSPVAGATGPHLLTPPLAATARYWVKITKNAESTHSRAALVTVSARRPYSLLAAGASPEGALGLGDTTETSTPAQAASASVRLAAGARHSLFLKTDGSLWGMGSNADGQLGVVGDGAHATPVRIVETGVAQIAAGAAHSLFLKTDGTLWGMGSNAHGQLAQTDTTAGVTTPVQIAADVAQISAGVRHSLFVKTDGTLWAVGDHRGPSPGPAAVQIAEHVALAAAGGAHSLFIKTTGELWAWGANDSGQLGDGTTENRSAPVPVAEHAVFAAAGDAHSLFIRSDRFLLATGRHAEGQLGAGALVGEFTARPRQIAANVVRASAGPRHSVFLQSDGALWAMGDNNHGQLGNGSRDSRALPAQIALDCADAAAGDAHSLFLKTPPSHRVEFVLVDAKARRTGGGALVQYVREGEAAVAPTVAGPAGQSLHQWSVDFSFVTGPLVAEASYRAAQTITFAQPTVQTFTPPSRALTLGATSSSGLPVAFELVSGPATLEGNVLTLTGGGQVVVRAVCAAGEANGVAYSAATPVQRAIEVKKVAQTLVFTPPSAVTYGDAPLTLVATTTAPGLPVSFELVSGPATLSDRTLAFTGAGDVVVRATQSGDDAYSPAAALTRTIKVAKKTLLVSAPDTTRAVGQRNPVFILNYSGFVGDDTLVKQGVIDAQPVAVVRATASSPPGDYAATLHGGSAPNYAFAFADPAPKLVVVGYGGAYEALIDGADHGLVPVGKLELAVAARGLGYTGTLRVAAEAAPIALRGSLVPSPDLSGATHTYLRPAKGARPELRLTFTVSGDAIHGTLEHGDAAPVAFADGVLLAPPPSPAGEGTHTLVLGPGVDADSTVVVPGSGHASATLARKTSILKLKGKLADGAALTATLKPSANRAYRLWVNPYKKRLDSFLTGRLALAPHPESGPGERFENRHHIPAEPATALFWRKAALPESTPAAKRDATHRAGFGPLAAAVRLDPWLPPLAAKRNQSAITLAQRLGLADDNATDATVEVVHGEDDLDLGQLAEALPTALALDAKGRLAIAAPVTTPPNRAAWKILKLNPATGAFSGRFVLRDPPLSGTRDVIRTVNFSGTFLQAPSDETDAPFAEGFFLLPALDSSAAKTAHPLYFLRPAE